MQKTLLGLACATALSATATAQSDSAWLALDQEITNLSTTMVDNHATAVSGFITTFYESNSDTDTGGWDFEGIRINFKSSVEDIKVKVSTDLKSGTASLKDAYARWEISDGIDITWGQFKRPFLYSYNVSGANQLFLMRTANASNVEARDIGVMLNGDLTDIGTWAVAAQNGADGITDELHLTGRVVANVVGNGAFGKHEGGIDFFGMDDTHASVAVAYAQENDATTEHTKLGVEAAIAMANFWAHIDFVDFDVDGAAAHAVTGTSLDGTSPMGITAAYMLQEDIELAVRYDDLDSTDDTTIMTIGANYYQVLPHLAKWSLNFVSTSSDTAALETDSIMLGLTLSF